MIAILVGLWELLAPPAGVQERAEARYPVTVQEAHKPWTLRHRMSPLEPAWRLVWERVGERGERPPERPPRAPERDSYPRP